MRRRERLLGALRMIALPMIVRRPATVPESDALMNLLCEVLRGEPLLGRAFERLRVVARHEDDQDGRRRLLAFLFDNDSDTPFAVAKVQSDLRNGSLQTEAVALTSAHGIVPAELQKTIPDLLRTYSDNRGEVLVVSALPGRTAWLEMHASLLPSRRVGAHFECAGRWLAEFHEATRHDDETTAVHGDFWAHNILHDRNDNVSVIDWENFTPAGSRYIDLFHYPLTYGQAYPGPFYRKRDAETAFAKTFLEKNRLSRSVRYYLESYCTRTGIPRPRMAAAFRDLLVSNATPAGTPHPGVRHLPWTRFLTMLDASEESVFS
ncbi:MAG: phosphotransferase [Acidobacteriota bacterium]|nr:phosphotransferase [Acidobacteriota bacterium]